MNTLSSESQDFRLLLQLIQTFHQLNVILLTEFRNATDESYQLSAQQEGS